MTLRYLIKSIIFVPLIASCGRSASSNEADDQSNYPVSDKESATIFITGQTEYSQETELNRETNPLLALYDSPIDLDMNVAKVEIKNGK